MTFIETADLCIGVDLVNVPELSAMLDASAATFRDMCWTAAEQEICQGSAERLAARWAAKEAVMKALGHGIGEIDPLDVEIVGKEGQRPCIRLRGAAERFAAALGRTDWALSMSHESDLAIAFVVARRQSDDGTQHLRPIPTTRERAGK